MIEGLSMGMMAPTALAAAVLGALAVIAHLTHRAPTRRIAYGAMLLLRRLSKRVRRHRQIRDRLLLLLRLLALLLVVLGAAGPYLAWRDLAPAYAGSGRVVILLDRSMSMSEVVGGGSLLARAKGEAVGQIEALPVGVEIGLVVFGDPPDVRTATLTEDKGQVIAAIEAVEPSLQTGDLRGALIEARRLLGGEAGEVFVFSDEAGPSMIPAAAEEIGRLSATGTAVVPRPVLAEPPRNVAVAGAGYGVGVEGGQVTLQLVNYGPDAVEVPCEVVLPDGQQIPVFVAVDGGAEGSARVTVPRQATGGVAQARCEDADLPSDDVAWFHLPSVGGARVLVVDGDPGDTPIRSEVYFLERALSPWGDEHGGIAVDVRTPGGMTGQSLADHRIVFLANVADPRPFGAALREFVRKGGVLVVAGGDNVTPDRYNEALGPILPAPLRPTVQLADHADKPVPLALPEAGVHPMLRPFERTGRAGFGRVGSWRALSFEAFPERREVRTLLRYEGGMPALVLHEVGSGAVLVWTSTVDLGWSNLPLQAIFMPLVQQVVGTFGGDVNARAVRLTARVGDRVSLPLPEGVADALVEDGEGRVVRGQIEGSAFVFTPDRPGGYRVMVPDGPTLAWAAVNLAPEESDVRRTQSLATVEQPSKPELFERRADLGGPMLGMGLLLLAASAAVASRVRPDKEAA